MPVTDKDVRRVLLMHPWLSPEFARRIAEDWKRKSTSTLESRKAYNREYQRLRRAEAKGEVQFGDVAEIVVGPLRKKKRSQKNEADTGKTS